MNFARTLNQPIRTTRSPPKTAGGPDETVIQTLNNTKGKTMSFMAVYQRESGVITIAAVDNHCPECALDDAIRIEKIMKEKLIALGDVNASKNRNALDPVTHSNAFNWRGITRNTN